MKTRELLRLVWQNVSQNKFKTVMTSIGILAGAATIVMVIAIGKGGQMDVADQFRNLNAGAIDITCQAESGKRPDFNRGQGGGSAGGTSGKTASGGMPSSGTASGGMPSGGTAGGGMPSGGTAGGGMPSGGTAGGGMPSGEMPAGGMPSGGEMPEGFMPFGSFGMKSFTESEWITLTADDADYLLSNIEGLSDATISYTTRSGADGGDLEEETVYTVAGVKPNYASLSNLELAIGEFITDEAEEHKEKSCVLGADAAEEIFGSAMEAYGSVLYIDKRIYVVDGVLQAVGSVSSGISPDDAVFIPYATGVKYLTGENVRPTLTVIAQDVEQVDGVIASAAELLENIYPNSEFSYSDAGSKMEAAEASNRILTMLLLAMAFLVFFVGGIGIMNVLFVSVKERTNEIGILKAIGCSRKNILTEFLLEASAISLLGGILGSMASLAVTPVVRGFGVRVELSAAAFGAALLFAAATGTLFGFYPAYKASRLVPVDALNAE